jgi:3-deoxy-D-manno-octulosonic-acid transferase
MENFAVLARALVARRGAIQVGNSDQLEQALGHLLGDSEARSDLIRNAEEVLAEHRGASARTARLVVDLASSR